MSTNKHSPILKYFNNTVRGFGVAASLVLLAACGHPEGGPLAEPEVALPSSHDPSEPVVGEPDPKTDPEIQPGDSVLTEGCTDPVLTTYTFTASSEKILNPERGMYGHVNLLRPADFSSIRTAGQTLAYAGVNIGAYRDTALPSTVLDTLESGFVSVRRAGIKVILRFVYSESMSSPDASLERVKQHILQLTPVLRRNADVIAVMQAGFIGAWGEWHASSSGLDTPEARAAVLGALLDALPSTRMLQVRTPRFKEETFGGPLTDAEGFTGTGAARVGHHNDCFLASSTDYGTYPSSSVETWKSFVAQEGRFTPVGGETCAVNSPRSDCPTATAEMARLHWTYLNNAYHPDVLARFVEQGCMSDIQRRLGYRLELISASMNSSVRPGGSLTLEVRLRNVGYAALFNARPVYVVLEGQGSRYALPLTGVDPRRWASGTESTLRHQLTLPTSMATGTYRVSLWLPDAASALQSRPEYSIRFANAGTWVSTSGLNVLTSSLNVAP